MGENNTEREVYKELRIQKINNQVRRIQRRKRKREIRREEERRGEKKEFIKFIKKRKDKEKRER